MADRGRPTLFVVAGPNGAGKTTFVQRVVAPRVKAPFVNADHIQRDVLKDPSTQAAYKAANMADAQRADLMAQRKDFITETTFSHPSKLALVQEAKAAGYRVAVYHVNVRSPSISTHRVAARVTEGGHNVPEEKIRERYERSPPLIRDAVRAADRAWVYDNSKLNQAPRRLISFENGRVVAAAENLPQWARSTYASDLAHLSPQRQNRAAASFADAQAKAIALGGDGSSVGIAGHRAGEHVGPIVARTAHHSLQQTGPESFIAHFTNRLAVPVADGDRVTLLYSSRQAPASVNFQSVSAAQLSLHRVMRGAEPTTPRAERAVSQQIDKLVAARANRNGIVLTAADAAAVRYSIATHALDAAQRGSATFTAQHRAALVEGAERAVSDGQGRSTQSAGARSQAAALGRLDGPTGANPFQDRSLTERYESAQQAHAQDQQRDQGMDR